MRAGVALTNCLQSIFRQLVACLCILQEMMQLRRHRLTITDHNIILARAEQFFFITPSEHTSGMPQASASKTRMVGIPASPLAYCRRGICSATRLSAYTWGEKRFGR